MTGGGEGGEEEEWGEGGEEVPGKIKAIVKAKLVLCEGGGKVEVILEYVNTVQV